MERVRELLDDYGISLVREEAAIYIASEDAVAISDIHFGFESAMTSLGVVLPKRQLKRALEVLVRLRTLTGASKLIVCGDLKHVFEKLIKQEREEVSTFIQRAFELGFKEVIVVRGNHDNYVSSLVKKLGATWIENYIELGKGIVITHGHEVYDVKGEAIVMGHEHPVLEMSIGGFKERLQAFLIIPRASSGFFIVLPAIGEYQSGNVVTLDRSRYLSPWIQKEALINEAIPVVSDKDIGTIALPKLEFLLTKEL
ncbi:MAG: metallophosphoesterase [Acidilobaceae archaeon]